MLFEGLILGFAYSITLMLLFSYLGIKRVCHYIGVIDFGLTGFMLMLSFGSVTGLVTTAFAGILISLELRACRWWFGTEHFTWKNGWEQGLAPKTRPAPTPKQERAEPETPITPFKKLIRDILPVG